MLTEISILFFGMAAFVLFAVFACYTAFIAPWKTYSIIYDNTDSFFLSFFPAFLVATLVCYFWILVSYTVLFTLI